MAWWFGIRGAQEMSSYLIKHINNHVHKKTNITVWCLWGTELKHQSSVNDNVHHFTRVAYEWNSSKVCVSDISWDFNQFENKRCSVFNIALMKFLTYVILVNKIKKSFEVIEMEPDDFFSNMPLEDLKEEIW